MNTNNKFSNTIHLVAGASKGIGKALVKKSSEEGRKVIAISRNTPTSPPIHGQWIKGDVAHPEDFIEQLPTAINCVTFCPGKVILGPIKRLKAEQMEEAYPSVRL